MPGSATVVAWTSRHHRRTDQSTRRSQTRTDPGTALAAFGSFAFRNQRFNCRPGSFAFRRCGPTPLPGELRRRGLRQARRESRRPNRSPPGGTSKRRAVRAADRRSLSPAGVWARSAEKQKNPVSSENESFGFRGGVGIPLPGSDCAGPLRGLPCVCWSRRAARVRLSPSSRRSGASLGGAIRPSGVCQPHPENRKTRATPQDPGGSIAFHVWAGKLSLAS